MEFLTIIYMDTSKVKRNAVIFANKNIFIEILKEKKNVKYLEIFKK